MLSDWLAADEQRKADRQLLLSPVGSAATGPSESTPAPTGARRWQLPLAVAILLVTAAGVGAALLLPHRQSWPAHWDPRVASIAAFDETHRGLRFKHPVPVVFLTDAAFKQKAEGPSTTTAQDRSQEQEIVAELRALGLTSGNPSLIAGSRNLVGADLVGFYDFQAKKVWVRGTDLTPYVRVVLAHELTHVLQDQNFGVLHPKDDDAQAAYTAVVEADAVRMQNTYLQSLSTADQQTYSNEQDALGSQVDVAASSVPQALSDQQDFPYQVGPHFIDVIVAAKGTSGIDDALRNPPTSTMEIIEPSRYLSSQQTVTVAPPALSTGELRLEAPSTAGAFELFQILSAHLDVGQAWLAARTWNGDSSIVYRSQGRVCVRLDVAALVDPTPLQTAFAKWVQNSGNAGHDSTSKVNGNVRLDACDPGPGVAYAASPGAVGPLDTLNIRGQLAEGVASSTGFSPAMVDCATDAIIEVAGEQGLSRLVDLVNNGDATLVRQFSTDLGLQARPVVATQCAGQTS